MGVTTASSLSAESSTVSSYEEDHRHPAAQQQERQQPQTTSHATLAKQEASRAVSPNHDASEQQLVKENTKTSIVTTSSSPKKSPTPFVQKLRSNAGSTIIAANFISSCWQSAWKDKESWKDRLAPLEALQDFLKATGIDEELSSSMPIASLHDKNKLITNLRILAHCQKVMTPTLQMRAEQVRMKNDQAEDGLIQAFDNDTLHRFVKYATAVYGISVIQAARVETGQSSSLWNAAKSEKEGIASHVGIPARDIVLLHESLSSTSSSSALQRKTEGMSIPDESNLPPQRPRGKLTLTLRHFIAIDHAQKAIVLSIRGTYSLQELLADLAAFTKPFCCGEAHSEIIAMAKNIWKAAGTDLVEQLQLHPDYELFLVGHSLGGSTASLLHLWLQCTVFQLQEADLDPCTTSAECDGSSAQTENDEDPLAIPNLDPPLPVHLRSSNIRCIAFGGLPVYCSSYNTDAILADGISTKEDKEMHLFQSILASAIAGTSINIVHSHDYAPFASIDLVRRLMYDIRTVDAYYHEPPTKPSEDEVGWQFHTRRWWNRQQVAKGRSTAPPPPDLIDALKKQGRVPSKNGAPILWMPCGQILWIVDESTDDKCDASDGLPFAEGDEYDGNISGAPDPYASGDGELKGILCSPIDIATQLDIFIHHEMFLDHLPSRYESALTQLCRH